MTGWTAGTGNDRMEGALGNDRYIVDSAGDTIQGEIGFSLGGGIDTEEASVDFFLTANLEILRLQGAGQPERAAAMPRPKAWSAIPAPTA